MNILTIAYTCEGKTDERFFGNIILRTFEEVLIEANSLIDIYDPVHISKIGEGNINKLMNVAQVAKHFHVLCVHVDADYEIDERAFQERINPAFEEITNSNEPTCKNLVAIVPIYMTEAWMLADVNIFIEEIGTTKTIQELNLPNHLNQVEGITDPKERIISAIRIAFEDYPKRRNTIQISDLYTPLSQKINIERLKNLTSYMKFREAVRNSLIKLNYLQV